MKNVCTYCGAVIEDGAKICTNCGKVAAAARSAQGQSSQFSNFSGAQGNIPGATSTTRATYAAQRSARQMERPVENYGTQRKAASTINSGSYNRAMNAAQQRIPFVTNETSGKEKSRSRIAPIIGTLIKICVVVVILYFLFAFVRVTLVKNAGYDFELGEGVKLASDNYGDAVDNYFSDGKWSYTLKTNKVSYTGTTDDGEEYVMTFGKDGDDTVVTRLTVDGKRISDDVIMDVYVMGMFMA